MENLTEFNKDQYIRDRYMNAINYYWGASKANKKWYKITRSMTIIFGAGVTLVASLTSSEIIVQNEIIEMIFKLGTPLLAAMLTIIAGFSQGFQWGSTWHNMIITAQELEREYDKFLVTPEDQRNYLVEAEKLNSFVITESKGFFERMLGTAIPEKPTNDTTII